MKKEFPDGVWPVMLTPFTDDNRIDFKALGELVDWYIDSGVQGLFADCQSSEMFFLTLEERMEIARFVKEKAGGRVPVIASGHVSDELGKQEEELNAVAGTGVDALILITNRLAGQDESDEIWFDNLKKLLAVLPEDIPLGFYECPYPYKRLVPPELLRWCADTGRFYFLKDTSCDLENMKAKMKAVAGTRLKLYNANTSTLLESLKEGAAGYSGVMANFHPQLYVWICEHFREGAAQELSDELTMMSFIEKQCYPTNAKYYLKEIQGLPLTTRTRVMPEAVMTPTYQKEVEALERISLRRKLNVQK